MATDASLRVLVTGATGYVGSRLIPTLVAEGHRVVAASRSTASTADYPWDDDVETRELDIDDDDLVRAAVQDIDAVVYLVHSMESEDFVRQDREAAERMAAACEDAGVSQIVYLSGLIPDGELSDHLRSRLEVEQVFLDSGVPAIVLRAAMIIGSGSTSYELLQRLSRRVPWVTPVPRWMRSSLQPVAVADVVHVLARALVASERNRHYDVGGDQTLSYPELLETFAEIDGLRRVRLIVPGVPQWLVGRACALISGLEANEVSSLTASLGHDLVCREDDVRRELLLDDYRFTSVREALQRSIDDSAAPGTTERGDVQSAAPTDPA